MQAKQLSFLFILVASIAAASAGDVEDSSAKRKAPQG
jgi:hypothetical protein